MRPQAPFVHVLLRTKGRKPSGVGVLESLMLFRCVGVYDWIYTKLSGASLGLIIEAALGNGDNGVGNLS